MAVNASTVRADLSWRWRHFSLFNVSEWHEVLRLRTAVFVVEQKCPYQEADDKDPIAWHLELHHGRELIGTLRILPPGIAYQESSLGRVAVRADYRRLGLGREVMTRALAFCDSRWPTLRLSAQLYLRPFYESLGFTVVGEPYLEDDIPHIEMLRAS